MMTLYLRMMSNNLKALKRKGLFILLSETEKVYHPPLQVQQLQLLLSS